MGITGSSPGIGITAAQSLLNGRAAARDGETRFVAALRHSASTSERSPSASRTAPRDSATGERTPELDHVAAEIARSVESRLPGRVSELQVRVVDDHFVLSGASNSYYVKQVAQHLAMNALDSHMLGRLVNEIEVR